MRPSVYLLQTYLFQPKIKYFLKNFNIFFAFMLCNFLVQMLKFFLNLIFFAQLKKPPQKVAYLWQLGVLFSLQPRPPKTAQSLISIL